MHIHILGICGTFMGGLAVLAEELGHEVSGSDVNVYPPMSTQLEARGIELHEGYRAAYLAQLRPDLIIVGNTMSRGNEVVEYILNNNLSYVSGPEWLKHAVLNKRHVIAVSGTHGKTTTTGMLMWILHAAGKDPGFLCGGVPKNFNISARLGSSPFFIIEADEYDTAFFDKRSKFVHYHPNTLIINNIEFDHADIFPDLAAIKRQFAHLLRLVPNAPAHGLVIYPHFDNNVKDVLTKGCWSRTTTFACNDAWDKQQQQYVPADTDNDNNAAWCARNIRAHATDTTFEIYHQGNICGTTRLQLSGLHNVNNALAALAASTHVGIDTHTAISALNDFVGIKRRLECVGEVDGITIFDDFAHHPTAVIATLEGVRAREHATAKSVAHKNRNAHGRIIVAIELASNTMRAGMHGASVIQALNHADYAYILRPQIQIQANWGLESLLQNHAQIPMRVCPTIEEIIIEIIGTAKPGDQIVIMSNKSFGMLQQKLLRQLRAKIDRSAT